MEILQQGPLSLDTFFMVIKQLLLFLGDLHRQHLVYQTFNPNYLLWNDAKQKIQVIDIRYVTTILQGQWSAGHLAIPHEILPYVSPEQTGRMHRIVDHRSDFYSLGVLAYQLLSGCLPFEGTDSMEWIHFHLAKEPAPFCIIMRESPRC